MILGHDPGRAGEHRYGEDALSSPEASGPQVTASRRGRRPLEGPAGRPRPFEASEGRQDRRLGAPLDAPAGARPGAGPAGPIPGARSPHTEWYNRVHRRTHSCVVSRWRARRAGHGTRALDRRPNACPDACPNAHLDGRWPRRVRRPSRAGSPPVGECSVLRQSGARPTMPFQRRRQRAPTRARAAEGTRLLRCGARAQDSSRRWASDSPGNRHRSSLPAGSA